MKRRGVWRLAGVHVCFRAFAILTGVSRNYLNKIMRHVVQNLGPPVDGRTLRDARDTPKKDHARSFFDFLWVNLAEPLAEAAREMEEDDYLMDNFHEHVLGAVPDDGAVEGLGVGTDREMRWLHPMTQKEMYELYVHMYGQTEAASETIFRQVYMQEWKKVLKIRARSQHALCQDCSLPAEACYSCPVTVKCLHLRLPAVTNEEECWKGGAADRQGGGAEAHRRAQSRGFQRPECVTADGAACGGLPEARLDNSTSGRGNLPGHRWL